MRKLTFEEWIEKAHTAHGDKYDYSKMVYVNGQTKAIIICPIHGEFTQVPNSHILGWGCKKCGNIKCSETRRDDTAEFIRKATLTHGNRYDYSKVEYQGNKIPVTIICRVHGDFNQWPGDHVYGKNCRRCTGLAKSNTEEYIAKARLMHGETYDYSKTVYVRKGEKITITCKIHGDFNQETSSHLSGRGCPACKNSVGEEAISVYLARQGIKLETQKRFPTCCDVKCLPFDIYMPDYNALIEFDGRQHFEPIGFFGGMEKFLTQQRRDLLKDRWVRDNGLALMRISFMDIENAADYICSFLESVDEKNRGVFSTPYDGYAGRGYQLI